MQKIGIYIDSSRSTLTIETPSELQFELRDQSGKLLVTGNKLTQPSVNINIKRLPAGTYALTISVEGETVHKSIELN